MSAHDVNPQGKQRMMSARMRAREVCPYFARGLQRLIPFETKEVPTLAVDERWRFYWNSDFAASQTVDELAMELIHELSHCLRAHSKRRELIHADPDLWNTAGDAEINDDLNEMATQIASAKRKPINEVPHLPEWTIAPGRTPLEGLPTGWMAEQYYVKLRDRQAKQGGSGAQKNPSQGPGGAGAGSPSQKGQGSRKGAPSGPGVASGSCGSASGGRPSAAEEAAKAEAEGSGVPGLSDVEQAHARKQVAKDIEMASKNSTHRGTIPGGWIKWATEQLEPPRIPWQQKLARMARGQVAYIAGAILHKYTRPSRRQSGIGYGVGMPILPALVGIIPEVAVLADTSGSMGADETRAVVRETKGILAATNCRVTWCACDAAVHELREVTDWRKLAELCKGGGGTSMIPGIKALMERKKRKPQVVICITDGHIGDPGPQPEGVRFIWVTVGKHRLKERPAPWGEHIDVDDVVPERATAA